jgi:hypothetical protein
MKKRPFYWYLILPAVYAGIMLFFALIQFRDTESESILMGPLVFTADRGSLETDETLSGLTIAINRGSFNFGPENPVSLRKDGTTQQVQLTGFQTLDNRVVVNFQQGFQLHFLQEERNGGQADSPTWLIEPILKEGNLQGVSFPFSMSSAIPPRYAGIPILVLGGEDPHYMRLPSGAVFDARGEELSIEVRERGSSTIRIERGSQEYDPFRYWLHGDSQEVLSVDYDRASEEFWTQAYEGWSNGRWINAGSGWRLPEGRRGFDSDLARAFLSESKDRGEYQVNYRKTSFYWDFNQRNWDYGVSPYFGRLTTSIPSYRQELVNRFYQQPEAFPAAYADWYLAMDTLLWPVHNQGSKEIKEEWSRRLDGEPDFSWSIKEVVGYLLGQIETQALRGDLRTKDYWDEMVQSGVLRHISQAPQGLMMVNSKGFWDSKLTIMASGLLKRVAGQSDTLPYGELAQALELSVYRLAQDHAMVPAVLVDTGEQVLEDGEVGPEELYALIRGGSGYPGITVVDPQRLPETFLYSGTVVESMDFDGRNLSITFKHPPGTDPSNGHYFILGNVPKVGQVKLHGIDRRSDYYFQEREEEDGYYYSTTTNTLYVKLLHQKRSDTVEITFLD